MSAARKIASKPQLHLVKSNDSFYELLFDEANDAILVVDCDTGKIQSANRRMQELTGFVKAELESFDCDQLFPNPKSEQSRKVRSQLFQAEMFRQSGFYEDIALQKKDGYLAFATLSVKTLASEKTGGKNISFCILHDMGMKKSMERDLLTKHMELKNAFTELERAHMELKSAQEALVQAGKLAALGELAAGVAHELNQPLSGVIGFTQELQAILKEKFPDPGALDFTEEVVKNGVRMKKIIQQLREFTRKSTEDYRSVDILTVINESLQLLEQQLKSRGISVNINADENITPVYCNPFQLEQVFINLATNARDAIEATGRGSGSIAIQVKKQSQFLEISFKDDGCGMSGETKGRAFDPFYTTKEVGKGTGLGLSVSYGILSKIHGSMMIESTPGRGALFRITIPVDYRKLHQDETKEV